MNPGAGMRAGDGAGDFRYLDDPVVRARMIDFSDGHTTRATFRVPAVHCLACVWLLENLFRLLPGLGVSRVNFLRKEVAVSFDEKRVRLSEVAGLLARLGYEPEFNLGDLTPAPRSAPARRLWLQIGVAGFAFGNIMLLSIANYLGLDPETGPAFRRVAAWISLGLALPVITFSARDYWRGAWRSLRQRALNIEVPIALGLVALFGQSAHDVWTGAGEGYFDSLCGLLFFLLLGRLFQRHTFDRLAFDRDAREFFPLVATRCVAGGAGQAEREEQVALDQITPGDRLLIRHGELIPADARLVSGEGRIDYSFVTGESEPVPRTKGDTLFAGGRQTGGALEVEVVKAVSQSYLSSLWDQEAFRKNKRPHLDAATNQYSRRFTVVIMSVATAAALFWSVRDPALAVRAFTAVLIVACPCALALAAPVALGTAVRRLGREGIFLKGTHVLEVLNGVQTVVFDKTGTLTEPGSSGVRWRGAALSNRERDWTAAAARQSTHPLATNIAAACAREDGASRAMTVDGYEETPGSGLRANVNGHPIVIGTEAWLRASGAEGVPDGHAEQAGEVATSRAAVAIDGQRRGSFESAGRLRPGIPELLRVLSERLHLVLLSGDNERERAVFAPLFGASAVMKFRQQPLDKLRFVQARQAQGEVVMMVGDGLNDAGALRQSDAGVAVLEHSGNFSPASDVILRGEVVGRLGALLEFARAAMQVVRSAFVLSALYNVVGVGIAAGGRLSPVVCAILMPLSSVSVVAFVCLAVRRCAGRIFEERNQSAGSARAAGPETSGVPAVTWSHPFV